MCWGEILELKIHRTSQQLELVNPQWELKNEYLHVTELFQSPFT